MTLFTSLASYIPGYSDDRSSTERSQGSPRSDSSEEFPIRIVQLASSATSAESSPFDLRDSQRDKSQTVFSTNHRFEAYGWGSGKDLVDNLVKAEVAQLEEPREEPPLLQRFYARPGTPVPHAEVQQFVSWSKHEFQRHRALAMRLADQLDTVKGLRREEQQERLTVGQRTSDNATSIRAKLQPLLRRTRPPATIAVDGSEAKRNDHEQFLYTNARDRILELTVQVVLVRTQVALQQKDWNKAENLAAQAYKLAEGLASKPLEGRCLFYKAVVQFEQGHDYDASEAFTAASACCNVYVEGNRISRYLAELRRRAG
ncbi:MAG: hypothetical protein M1833_005494 [Piccolia ochrophora]|nr:MAG: hypothetical protein M1833_005494 [Piccolia ochrophora]